MSIQPHYITDPGRQSVDCQTPAPDTGSKQPTRITAQRASQTERANIAAGRMPDIHRLMPVAVEDDWEATTVDITRLDRTDPADKRRINNAWRRFKQDAPEEAADLAEFFPRLRAAFPGAGIEVPADTLYDPK